MLGTGSSGVREGGGGGGKLIQNKKKLRGKMVEYFPKRKRTKANSNKKARGKMNEYS